MNLKTLMALAMAAAFATQVFAQSAAGRGLEAKDQATAGDFSTIDRNNDGYISRDEARDLSWSSRFSELDKDNDGRLSQSEFDALQAGAAGTTGDKPGQKQ